MLEYQKKQLENDKMIQQTSNLNYIATSRHRKKQNSQL